MNHALIVSLSRSGGKLLRTLLDGHPEANVFPFEHWNRTSKNKIPTRKMEAFERLSVEDKLATAGADHLERKLTRLHPPLVLAEVMRKWRADTPAATTLADMYSGLAHAYFSVVGRPPDNMVVNHCGSLCRFTREQLDAVFGAGKHLLTIRDPRAVFASMQGLLDRKFTIKRIEKGKVQRGALERHVARQEVVDSASGYLREFCQDYRTMVAEYAACPAVIRIRFEELVRFPEDTMRRLAAQLGINWDPTLLAATELGIFHPPNSSFGREGAGIHAQAADDWVRRIAPSVRLYIEDALAEEMAALGYQRIATDPPELLPAPLLENA
jgi:hypothetical protein